MSQEELDLRSNRVLTPADREALRPTVAELARLCPDIMARKIPEAAFQNAFIFAQAKHALRQGDSVVVVGGFEDPIGPALRELGYDVDISDPHLDGRDARAVWLDSVRSGRRYDVVVCCSVLEHAADEAQFVRQLYQVLHPGGVALLTTDFRDDWQEGMPAPDQRLYTAERLRWLAGQLPEGSLLAPPSWGPCEPYFEFNGVRYCFCSLAFRRLERPTAEEQQAVIYLFTAVLREESEANSRLREEIVSHQKTLQGAQERLACQQETNFHLREEIVSLQQALQGTQERLARYKAVEDVGPLTLRLAGRAYALSARFPTAKRLFKDLLHLHNRPAGKSGR
jgi:SAM-dependent methyltransferase